MPKGSSGRNLPLAINLVGPMVLQRNGDWLDIWLPDLSDTCFQHQAGIATGVDSMAFDPGSYRLENVPSFTADWPEPYCPPKGNDTSEIYNIHKGNSPADNYIRITLPRPLLMAGLFPEKCKMIYNGVEEAHCCATGMRLLYPSTGAPTMTGVITKDGSFVNWQLPINVVCGDPQVEVSISYHPYVHDKDPRHPEARSDFKQMAVMVGVTNLKVEYPEMITESGPVHDCINPIATIPEGDPEK